MAGEATVRTSLQIRKASGSVVLLNYQSQPSAFLADVNGTKGPTPGAVTVDNAGTDVDLSELTTPGFCRISNQSLTGYLEYGIWDPETLVFYPFGEVHPGESYVLRLSRNIQEEYIGTGTGTTGATNRIRFKGHEGSTTALIEVFEA